MLDKVCVLIPACNAQWTLGSVLDKVEPLEVDTLVVDDGSSDETGRVASDHGVHLLKHPLNLGKGAAIGKRFDATLMQA